MSIRERVRRLGDRSGCPECGSRPEVAHVVYPEEDEPTPEPESCPKCGRSLGFVIEVVYEAEGEG